MTETFYDVLGVDQDADEEAVEQAYRELIHEWHPDVSDHPNARERFLLIKEAHEVLTSSAERARYDRLGHEEYVGDGGTTGGRSDGASGREETGGRSGGASGGDATGGGSGGASGREETAGGSSGGDSSGREEAGGGGAGDRSSRGAAEEYRRRRKRAKQERSRGGTGRSGARGSDSGRSGSGGSDSGRSGSGGSGSGRSGSGGSGSGRSGSGRTGSGRTGSGREEPSSGSTGGSTGRETTGGAGSSGSTGGESSGGQWGWGQPAATGSGVNPDVALLKYPGLLFYWYIGSALSGLLFAAVLVPIYVQYRRKMYTDRILTEGDSPKGFASMLRRMALGTGVLLVGVAALLVGSGGDDVMAAAVVAMFLGTFLCARYFKEMLVRDWFDAEQTGQPVAWDLAARTPIVVVPLLLGLGPTTLDDVLLIIAFCAPVVVAGVYVARTDRFDMLINGDR